jgi:endonuclease G
MEGVMVLPRQLIEQTRERYQARTAQREIHVEKIKSGSPLEADSPERVQKRMNRIAGAEASRPAPAASAAMALERIMGRSDLMSVNYLEMGLQAARCVGRITIRTRTGQTLGYGSGFTVAPRLLITNNHVLDAAEAAAASRVEFNYQEDARGNLLRSVVLNIEPDVFFLTDKRLDFTMVAVSERSVDGAELGGFVWLPLIEEQGKVIVGEYVNIIQHPNGEPKQLALRENQLLDLLPDFLHYRTDTAPGSSGSPVFNDQWEVVGLHHSGVPRTNADGEILTRDGLVWREEMGEHRIDWMANEGVRTSRIVQAIRAANLSTEQDRLRRQMFESQASLTRDGQRPSPVHQQEAMPLQATVAEDGTATWTIPLQVSVRLGPSGAMRMPVEGGEEPLDEPRLTQQDRAVTPSSSGASLADSAEVREALREFERAREQPYYDAEEDEVDRQAYYADIDKDSRKGELYQQLSRLLASTHKTRLPYKPMRHVYPWVDLHPDLKLRSIYSGKAFDAEQLIRDDARIETERTRMVERMRSALAGSAMASERLEATLDRLEASLPFNCEHVVPQSWFDKAEPMRGDLHHLFACEVGCNSFRGNIPYFDFPDFEEVVRGECGKRERSGFEPSNGKGAAARATLYFLLRYPGEINAVRQEYVPERIDTLLAWHFAKPPMEYERHRNASIFKLQGNRNPLVDDPKWADRIDFTLGLGR